MFSSLMDLGYPEINRGFSVFRRTAKKRKGRVMPVNQIIRVVFEFLKFLKSKNEDALI